MSTSATTVLLVFLLAPVALWGQERNSNWYFGEYSGVDFNNIPPLPLNSNPMNSIEGVASISDQNGQLLFYCDTMVWNSQHQPMQNGGGLYSHFSSTQACLVLPKPGTSHNYIIFTTPDYMPVIGNQNNAHWSEVDMTMDGGLGAVIQKNVLLMDSSSEKLTATLHENGTDYWVMMHRLGSSAFVAYQMSAIGFVDTVYSYIGPEYSKWSANQGIGWMNFSLDGTKMANANWKLDMLEIYDFDNSTGILSNRVELSESEPYGTEFSPNGQLIYCTVGTNVSTELLQFDISSGDSAIIANSRTALFSESGLSGFNYLKALALAPDSKIYVCRVGMDTLGVINGPDQAGLACNFVHAGLPLSFGNCIWGLPNFIKKYAEAPDAIEETARPVELKVFPVPAKGSVVIEIPNSWQGNALRMELFDQRGSLLRNAEITFSKQLVIECKDLESGVYQGAIYANRELAGVFRVVFE